MVEVSEGNSGVVIWIQDNGSGMTEGVLTHIFDPFFTTKSIVKSLSLGLSISYQIVVEKIVVEKHGGNLKCISAPGEGTEFLIEIQIRQQT